MAEPDSAAARLKFALKVFQQLGTDPSVPGTRRNADEIEFAVLGKDRGVVECWPNSKPSSLRHKRTDRDPTAARQRGAEERTGGIVPKRDHNRVVEVVIAGHRNRMRIDIVEDGQEMVQHFLARIVSRRLRDHIGKLRAEPDTHGGQSVKRRLK